MGNSLPMRFLTALFLLSMAAEGFCAAPDLDQQIALARRAQDSHATIELLRRWLDSRPGDPAAVEELTTLWLRVSDFNMAEISLALSSAPDPGFVARTQAAILFKRDEKLADAIVLLQGPQDRATRLLLADYLKRAGRREEQLKTLDALIASEGTPALILDRAEARAALDDPEGSLADFFLAASLTPDDDGVKSVRPRFERLQRAIEAIDALPSSNQKPAEALRIAYWWMFAGYPQRAFSPAQSVCAMWPTSIYAKILETRSLVATGKMDAQTAMRDLQIDVNAPLEDDQTRDALISADFDLAKKPNDPALLVRRASWLNYWGQMTLAMRDIDAALTAVPTNPEALELAVAINRKLGNLPAATAYAEKLVSSKAPRANTARAFSNLALLALETSQLNLALDFADRSLAAQPNSEAWKTKAACYTRLGQTAEAADALANAGKAKR